MLLRLLHATEMLFVITMRDLMFVPVMRDSPEMGQPAMVYELIFKSKISLRHARVLCL